MIQKGTIVSLQLCPGYRKPMNIVEEAEFIANLGMNNDVHARANSGRQALLIEAETLQSLNLQPGEIKENITTSGIELMKLKPGARLKLGKETILEISQACSPCSRMEEIRPGLIKELAGKRGMLATVVAGGIVRTNDSIEVIE